MAGTVGRVKPQSACYERHGWRRFRTLQRLTTEARHRAAGHRGRQAERRRTTNDAYAEAFLGADAPLAADAVTVHPYLGLAAMDAFVTRAHTSGSALLVVTRSSNAEGRAVRASGPSVEQTLLREIGALNARLAPGQIGPIGAVVGPTYLEPALDLAAANAVFLAPVSARRARPPPTSRGSSPPSPTA